jgi:hypothetical protein
MNTAQVKVSHTVITMGPTKATIWLTLETPIEGKPNMLAMVDITIPDPTVAAFVADSLPQLVRQVFKAPGSGLIAAGAEAMGMLPPMKQ